MKKIHHILIMSCIGLMLSIACHGQRIFSEGILKFNVYLNQSTTSSGIYLVSVKSGFIKREIAMNNGFNNVTIYNFKNGKSYSLNIDENDKYALEITAEEQKNINIRFENAQITPNGKTKKIIGYQCQGMNVQYSNGDQVEIYVSRDVVPQSDQFNTMFPGLVGIALEYTMKTPDGNEMRFTADQMDVKVIDTKIFNIPPDYKIVTKAELEKIK